MRGNSFLRFGSTPIKDLIDGNAFDLSSDSEGISDIYCHVSGASLCFELQVKGKLQVKGTALYALILIYKMTTEGGLLLRNLNYSTIGLTNSI